MPRGGSTWLMELILSQPTFKAIDEPLNLEYAHIRDYSGIRSWDALYTQQPSSELQTYFERMCSGASHFKDTNFRRNKHPRYLTRRIVFKIIHGGEDKINWFRDTFNGRIVFLIRHPIAVSLSREHYPRLEAFLSSDYQRHFTQSQLQFARKIIGSGSKLERGVVSWCFQNAVPLRQRTDDWALISYEQLVLEPVPVLEEMARKLELPELQRMQAQLADASGSNYKSDRETQQLLGKGKPANRSRLVEKWRDKVSEEEERRAMDILGVFELDTYSFGDALPNRQLWLRTPGEVAEIEQ